ncbi:MAG: FG-GAP-like repeat-containing protein [Planctomycetota bacterium]
MIYGPSASLGGSVIVGREGSRTIDVSAGTLVAANAIDTFTIAQEAGSLGLVRLDGPSSIWSHSSSSFVNGGGGDATVEILNGALMNTTVFGGTVLARDAGSTATLRVSGAGSQWLETAEVLTVGGEGTAQVIVEDGGVISVFGLTNTANGLLAGNGSVQGNVVNFGDIRTVASGMARGTASSLSITGDLDQFDDPMDPTRSGRVIVCAFESGGAVSADSLLVSGEAALAGSLIIETPNASDPTLGAETPVLTASTISCRFDVAFMPGLAPNAQGDGRFLKVEYPVARAAGGRGVVSVNLVVDTLTGDIATDAAQNFDVSGTPVAAAIDDLNGDGNPDLAVAIPNGANPGDVVVLLNSGSVGNAWQGFGATIQLTVGVDPQGIDIGDLYAAGGLDIAVANASDGTVQIFTNDGAFSPSIIAAGAISVGSFPKDVLFANLDNDKWDDLATVNGTAATIQRFKNVTLGQFAATSQRSGVGAGPVQLIAADFDLDGFPDLVSANTTDASVSVLRGDGAGGFAPAANLPLGGTPRSIAAVNLDPDEVGQNDLDLAVVVSGGGGASTIEVLHNDYDDANDQLIFAPAATLVTGGNPTLVLPSDLNGDGQVDLVAVNDDPASIRGIDPLNEIAVVLQSAASGPCPGDTDGSGVTEIDDVMFVINNLGAGALGAQGTPGDANGDGLTTTDDVTFTVSNLGCTP